MDLGPGIQRGTTFHLFSMLLLKSLNTSAVLYYDHSNLTTIVRCVFEWVAIFDRRSTTNPIPVWRSVAGK